MRNENQINTQAVISTTVTDANGNPLNFPLAQYSTLQQYDTNKVLDAVSDFVCFDAGYMVKYLERFAVMVNMSNYKKMERESMECFIEAMVKFVSEVEEANNRK